MPKKNGVISINRWTRRGPLSGPPESAHGNAWGSSGIVDWRRVLAGAKAHVLRVVIGALTTEMIYSGFTRRI